MWDFDHAPRAADLQKRYNVHLTQPSQCALKLQDGRAGLGLIPVAALTPEMAIVPGCTIASLHRVRSIQLIVKAGAARIAPAASPQYALERVRTVAADTASRSSLAYAQILFRRFLSTEPTFLPCPADPVAMLARADAALLIGDPALLALESRASIEAAVGPCHWVDLAEQWRLHTGLPWVAAVWAARPAALTASWLAPAQLIDDLQHSRDSGLANISKLVAEWQPRIALPAATIHHYLTHNIHYLLDQPCIDAIKVFRRYAAEAEILPPLPGLRFF